MLHGIWALLERSLRFDARDRWSHALRLAALLAGYSAMWSAAQSARWFGAPGLNFFQTLVQLNGLLIAAAGIGFFSSAITEEKEEGTLGLMLMTGQSPLGILLGKSGSRLVQAALLVLLQIPFALLAVTLGGVTPLQVFAVYAALIALLFFVANAALLCSVLAPNTRSASFWMVVLTIVYPILFWASYELGGPYSTSGSRRPLFAALTESFFFFRVGQLLTSGAHFTLVGKHEIVHIAAGMLCFALAWLAFPWATRQPDHEPLPRGLLGVRVGRRWWWAPGRVWPVASGDDWVWPAAIEWKDFHFLIGGWPVMAAKFAGDLGLWGFLWWDWHQWYPRAYATGALPNEDMAATVAVPILSLLLAVEAAVLASRVFHDELRGQTWSALILLPLSLGQLAYRKVFLCLSGLLPVLSVLGMVLFFTEQGRRGLNEVLDEAMFWGFCSLFVTIVHFSAWYSLYVRWGAIPLAAATTLVPFSLILMLFSPGGRDAEQGFGIMLCFVSALVCGILHHAIGVRLSALAAK